MIWEKVARRRRISEKKLVRYKSDDEAFERGNKIERRKEKEKGELNKSVDDANNQNVKLIA